MKRHRTVSLTACAALVVGACLVWPGHAQTNGVTADYLRATYPTSTNYFLGKTGIGTNAPDQQLHVVGNAKVQGGVEVTGAFQVPKQGDVSMGGFTNGVSDQGIAATNLALRGGWVSYDGSSQGMYVSTNGNVGVGTASPSVQLDVAGSGKFSGDLIISNANLRLGPNAGSGNNTNVLVFTSTGAPADSPAGVAQLWAESVVSTALPSGGNVTTSGNYVVHTFTSSGVFVVPRPLTVDCLVVAGGGGGAGRSGAGGGGAGGVISNYSYSISAQSYTVTVGAGGPGSTAQQTPAGNGSNSVFGANTAIGGGGGGSQYVNGGQGANGGSGGGGALEVSATTYGGTGTVSQGNDGGGNGGYGASPYPSGGGGGAGASGGTASANNVAGNGGNGMTNSITGTATAYGGGGGGGLYGSGTAGAGGSGGGGAGSAAGQGGAGTANTGGGGGGSGNNYNGGAGGSGVVIIRYDSTTQPSLMTNVELRVRDSAGNLTTLSTHEGRHHVIKSHNSYTGEGRCFDVDAAGDFMQSLLDGVDLETAISVVKANGSTNLYWKTVHPKELWDVKTKGPKPEWLVEFEKGQESK